jgi:preprotein translocase subunit SecG
MSLSSSDGIWYFLKRPRCTCYMLFLLIVIVIEFKKFRAQEEEQLERRPESSRAVVNDTVLEYIVVEGL